MELRRQTLPALPAVVILAILYLFGCGEATRATETAEAPTSKALDGVSAWPMEDWAVRAVVGRDVVEFGRTKDFRVAPTNDLRVTSADGSQELATTSPFSAGIASPSITAVGDTKVLIVGRPCSNISFDNVDSSGVSCMDAMLEAATYDLRARTWTLETLPAKIQSLGAPAVVELVGGGEDLAYLTAFADHSPDAAAYRAVWHLGSKELKVVDAGWSADDEVSSCVLGDGTRVDVVNDQGLVNAAVGQPNGQGIKIMSNVDPRATSTERLKSPPGLAMLRCTDRSALAVVVDATAGDMRILATEVVGGSLASTNLEDFVLREGEGMLVAVNPELRETVFLGDRLLVAPGLTFGGYVVATENDVLVLDNYGGSDVVWIQLDRVDLETLKDSSDPMPPVATFPPKNTSKAPVVTNVSETLIGKD